VSFRILCADECEMIQRGIEEVARQCNCPIEKFVASVPDLEVALREEHFDVLITDLRLGSFNMIEVVADIKKTMPELKAILYTSIPNASIVAQSLAYQFHDVAFKTGRAEKLARCLAALVTGAPPADSPLLAVKSFLELKNPDLFKTISTQLTRREQQVLVHLSFGLSNREIALNVGVSVETIKEHVQNVLRKLSLKDRTAAAVWALRSGVPHFEPPV